jgi:3-isopropylmalate dehydrogenase
MDILILPGDGIGPEITAATVTALEALDQRFGLGLAFSQEAIGFESLSSHQTTLTDEVVEKARRADGVILGPVSTAEYPGRKSGGLNPSAELRIRLDLYANLRPSTSRRGIASVAREMDILIVRENTEGFYADRNMYRGGGELMPTPDVALAVRKVTALGSRRLGRLSFEQARKRRGRVTAVHKANVLEVTDGLFLRELEDLAKDYPDVSFDKVLIDTMAALLIQQPERFDVVAATNMYGDILSNEAAALTGGLGLAASLNVGDDQAVAQAVHGSAPELAGKDTANPTSLILSSAMLLSWLGERSGRKDLLDAASCLRISVDDLLADTGKRTADLGGKLGTSAFAEAIRSRVMSEG